MAMNPLHQFELQSLVPLQLAGFDLSLTNQTLWTGIALAAILIFLMGGIGRMALVPGRWQSLVELTVEFVRDLTKNTAGHHALPFLPLVLTTFLFIAALNLIGMVPKSFTVTSQFTTTAFMGVMVFLLVLAVGVYTQGLHFFSMFLPKGTPWWLVPLIVPLEIISFLARPLTLAVRLAANMVAGHVLLKIFAGFCVMLLGLMSIEGADLTWGTLALTSPLAILPFGLLVALTGLEVFVALLQAYIFTILTLVYLNDALHGH
jgi:F-type H+-transporting ATPase subunit a